MKGLFLLGCLAIFTMGVVFGMAKICYLYDAMWYAGLTAILVIIILILAMIINEE